MGKRSTTSTKSGRAMNPADQARKEARRRELKKNKKQRQVVREAVIKSKDPKKVIEELERLDQMEYNIHELPPLPDHVLLERRKRLLGNFNRCLSLYEKEDKAQYSELKKMMAAYHRKHDELRKYYDAVKRAQNVSVDDIALPAAPEEDVAPVVDNLATPRFSQGPVIIAAPKQLSWEAFSDDLSDTGGRQPPGAPCYPPPSFSDDSDEEIDTKKDSAEEIESEDEAESEEEDQELDNKDHQYKQPDIEPRTLAKIGDVLLQNQSSQSEITLQRFDTGIPQHDGRPSGQLRPKFLASGMPPPTAIPSTGSTFRNVPPPSLANLRFPPPRLGNPALSGMMLRSPGAGSSFSSQGPGPIGPMRPSLVADSVSHRSPAVYVQSGEAKATFAAKPQLRNTMAEVTRLVPTAVKVKREEQIKPKPKPIGALGPNVELIPHRPASSAPQATGGADQAYEAFMKEMQGLL